MERPTSKTDSARSSDLKAENLGLLDQAARYALDLPIAPAWFSETPKGSWEDGYQLSLAALDLLKGRPEIFAQRDQRMCDVEFVL